MRGKIAILDGCDILVKTPWKSLGMTGQNSTHIEKIQYTVKPFLEVCKFVYVVFDSEPLPYKRMMQRKNADDAHQSVEDASTYLTRLDLVRRLNQAYKDD